VLYIALMAAAFVANVLFSVNVIYIILAAAAVGILAEAISHLRGGKTGGNSSKEEGAQ
jgi:hypothetical protein